MRCPICLESPFTGPNERCENHHLIHRECARKMAAFMPLRCPLCRSKLVCPKCRARKTRLWCECSSDVWHATKQIYVAHLFIVLTIMSSPIKDVGLGAILLLINAVVMMRRVTCLQRAAEDVKDWNALARLGLVITHRCMDLMCGMLAFVIVGLVGFYTQKL